MPALTKCRWCNEVLVCEKCGKRQTPELKRHEDRKAMQVYVSPEIKESIRVLAEAAGCSVSEYISRRLEAEEKKEGEE